ncbi:MAG: FAD-binding protein [Planctomycetaceae bacterium]|nr:FAD-binding protein [Planctomycetaceae bacterium]
MDPQRHRIQEDLRGLIAGQVLCDDVTIQQYATDASIFQIVPLGVVRPTTHEDVVAVVNYAREHQIPLIPRGCGSGLAGESLGNGLIIDFSTSMTQVLAVGRDSVTVQPGLILSSLSTELLKYERILGVDPGNRSYGTVGGAVARDSCGSRWHDHGSIGEQVLGARLVLADGTTIHLGQTASESTAESRAAKLLLQNQVLGCRERIESLLPSVTTKVRPAGYRIQAIQLDGAIEMLPLMAGSEGTLAIMTEVTLRTFPLPNHRGVALLFFSRITDAARVSAKLRNLPIRACDLVDRRLLSLAREADPRYRDWIPQGAEAMLLVEAQSESQNRLLDTLSDILVVADGCLNQGVPHYITVERNKRDLCWRLVRRIIPTLYRLRGSTRAVPFLEDILIPPEEMDEFLVTAQERLNQQKLTASYFSHASQGRIQIRPFIDLADPADMGRLEALTEAIYEDVWQRGGAVGTYGALGLSRTPYFRRQAEAIYPAHAEIKRIFDPNFILNPGKIIRSGFETYHSQIRSVLPQCLVRPNQSPSSLESASTSMGASSDSRVTSLQTSDLGEVVADGETRVAVPKELAIIEPQLNWDPETLAHNARNCNGCGQCRTLGRVERMCPVFRVSREEAASPRAKANLLRAVITGHMPAANLSTAEMKSVTDTCFNCHQCRIDCPAGADIPKIVNELRAQYVANNGLGLAERLLLRMDWMYAVASASPTLAHYLMTHSWSRWLLGRITGISAQRKLPRVHGKTFLQWAKRKRLHHSATSDGPKVVLFVDAFVNWNDPELGRALVAILEHHGIAVTVPLNQKFSGLSLISAGAINPAKKIASANVAILAEAVRDGATILTIEPAATLALKHEYLHILAEPDAKLVADNTTEATQYLWQLHEQGKLRTNFRETPIHLAHHLPCHQRATVDGNPGVELLKLIPKLNVTAIQKGCSGMAGLFGVFERNYRTSLKIGAEMMREVRQDSYQAGTTECSSCRIQMEQDTDKPTVHPLKILARAYGLMPELGDVFERRGRAGLLS